MSDKTDWEGQPIPEGEKPSDIVLAWEISPHPTNREYDLYVERSWQGMAVSTVPEDCEQAQWTEVVLSWCVCADRGTMRTGDLSSVRRW